MAKSKGQSRLQKRAGEFDAAGRPNTLVETNPFQTIPIQTKEEFRQWLKKFSKTEKRVAVLLHKKHTGKKSPSHRELIEEAICFGWIDTTIKRLDENRFLRYFAKRSDRSKWSSNTLSYAKQLLNAGRMTAEGLHFYNLGKAKKTHDHGLAKDPDVPDDLMVALKKSAMAKKNFSSFSPSTRKALLRWLLRAKRAATREARVLKIVKAAQDNNKFLLSPTTKENG